MDLYEKYPYLETIVKRTGYQTLGSMMFLHYLVKLIQPKDIIELGTGLGCSAIFMALALPEHGRLVSIDNYQMDPSLAKSITEPLGNIIKCGLNDRVQLLEQDTKETLDTCFGSFDFVFMDASHNKTDLLLEYEAISGSLRDDFVLVVDDIHVRDSYSFVTEIANECKHFILVPYHNGMAALDKSGINADKISQVIAEVEALRDN